MNNIGKNKISVQMYKYSPETLKSRKSVVKSAVIKRGKINVSASKKTQH